MIAGGIVKVSPSLLSDVATCETKGYTRHVRGYTSRVDAIKAVAGQGFHAAIANYLDPSTTIVKTEAALAKFHEVYDPAFARLAPENLEPGLTPHNLHRVLARWIEMNPHGSFPWKRVLMVEQAFESRRFEVVDPVTGQRVMVILITRPDLVVEDHNDVVRWVDTKTTGWRIEDESWQRNLKLSLQAGLYTDALQQRFPGRAVMGGWFNAIELRKLPGDTEGPPKMKKDGTPAKARLCPDHQRPYAECGIEHAKSRLIECLTTPERVARAVLDARDAAVDFVRMHGETDAIVSTLNMRGTESGSCRFCPAAEWCLLAGRNPEVLENFMIHDPWIVEEGVRV